MLEHTFIHIPGIGKKSEQKIWQQGVTSLFEFSSEMEMNEGWDDEKNKTRIITEQSLEALENHDYGYFLEKLPSREHWRALSCFAKPAYLDIETTGLDHRHSIITTIGIFDGEKTFSYIYDQNLNDFIQDIQTYDVIISYNGKSFDVPFINSFFDTRLTLPHIDLRYILGALGLKGGLKGIEKTLGLGRTGVMADIDGYTAVLLWNEYIRNGNEKALESLCAYNLEDVINLKPLAAIAHNRKLQLLPENFSQYEMNEEPYHPPIPYEVDEETVMKVTSRW